MIVLSLAGVAEAQFLLLRLMDRKNSSFTLMLCSIAPIGRLLLLLALVAGQAAAQSLPSVKVTPLTKRLYVHTSYRTYQGTPFPANGLIARTRDGIVLVDTGWDVLGDSTNTRQLLDWIDQNLHEPVRFCIVTHYHDDRVAGISLLRKAGVRVISTALTAELAAREGYEKPEGWLPADTTLMVGRLPIRCYFAGEGHTSDNIVVWFPTERVLFGGCLVKSYAAFGLGNIANANLTAWPNTIRQLQRTFPNPRFVVPGHQEWDKTTSLEQTLRLLELKR